MIFRGDSLLVREGGDRSLWPLDAQPAKGWALTHGPVALGMLDGRPAWAGRVDPSTELPEGVSAVPLRPLHAKVSVSVFDAASLAAQLLYFEEHYVFCARCAGPLEGQPKSRARVCTRCKHEWYPRVSPCAIVLVHDGDRVLMTRHERFPPGMYGLVAGFVEASESVEQCAAREAFEECGVRLRALRYFGSQPWSFPHQLMLGFSAEYAGGELVVDRSELEEARWFHRDELPVLPPSVSIARKLIDAWRARAIGATSP